MKNRSALLVAAVIAVIVIGGTVLLLTRARRRPQVASPVQTPVEATTQPPQDRMIKARLFYVADDGTKLVSVERDVRFAERTVDQAKELIEAQLFPPSEPFVSAIPAGTKLRALFLTREGQAFVDVSNEISTAHSGGALDELLTVYTIVHALTANMPAITAVQVLIDGKEVDTLAGHVDLSRPLLKNLAWVQ